jgi:hypothetical protein
VVTALVILAACGPGRPDPTPRTQAYPLSNQAFTGTSGTIAFTERPGGSIEARIELEGTVEGEMHPAHILRTFTAVNGTTGTETPYSAELVIGWLDTTTVKDADGIAVELPIEMTVTLTVDETEAAALTLNFSWYDAPACDGPIAEPSSFSVSGTIGVEATVTLSDSVSAWRATPSPPAAPSPWRTRATA